MRYLPLTDTDRREMLAVIGVDHIDELFVDVPPSARLKDPVDLPHHQGEMEVELDFRHLALKNKVGWRYPFFCGAGAYRHHVPASVDHIIQRSEFLTSYTPYQPEIAQGTLQYLFEFQTQVAVLTGMEVANASMYDGSTAAAEAVMMATRVTRRKRAVLSGGVHPHYAATTQTMCGVAGVDVVVQPYAVDGEAEVIGAIDADTAAELPGATTVFVATGAGAASAATTAFTFFSLTGAAATATGAGAATAGAAVAGATILVATFLTDLLAVVVEALIRACTGGFI